MAFVSCAVQFAWFINLLYVDVNSESDMAIFGEHVRTRFVCLSNICFGITFEIASTILSFEANFLLDVKLCLCCTFGSSAPLNLQDKEGLKHQLEDRVLYLLNQKYFIFLCIPAD